ncbi:hypothetical protein HDC94_001213 [Leifsonia sp. AK011]|nr:hypothetical protein [Leifsonia sp. AK011]
MGVGVPFMRPYCHRTASAPGILPGGGETMSPWKTTSRSWPVTNPTSVLSADRGFG